MKQCRGKGSQEEESSGHRGSLMSSKQAPLGIEVFFTLHAIYFSCFNELSSLNFIRCFFNEKDPVELSIYFAYPRSKDVRRA
jgi:hypothetical protein